MYLVSGISGAKAADMAAVAPVLFPEMKARGAKPGDLVALLAATGAQTETIPPSLVLITIGSVTGVSIAALFTGGLLPGLVLAATLSGLVWWRYRDEDLRHVERATGKHVLRTLVIALPALALPFVIRAAVVEGVCDCNGSLDDRHRVHDFRGARDLSPVRLAAPHPDADRNRLPVRRDSFDHRHSDRNGVGADAVRVLALIGGGDDRLPGGPAIFIAVSIVAFMILGSVLEGIPAIVLFGPLLFPIARAVGVHEVHYAMIVILAMGIGLFAPPFGVGYYAACAIGEGRSGGGHQADLGLFTVAPDRTGHRRGVSVDFHWIPGAVSPESGNLPDQSFLLRLALPPR